MACFLVSAAEAVVVTGIEKHEEKIEKARIEAGEPEPEVKKVPMSRKLKWLTYMLWGGVVLLAFEHVWHGEVVPWFPFLTAMADPADAAEMFGEVATVGVTMAVIITVTWLIMCKAADVIMAKAPKVSAADTEA